MKKPRREWFAPRFSLRALLIAMLVAGPLCAFGWMKRQEYRVCRVRQAAEELYRERVAAAIAVSKLAAQIGGGSSTRTLSPEEIELLHEKIEALRAKLNLSEPGETN